MYTIRFTFVIYAAVALFLTIMTHSTNANPVPSTMPTEIANQQFRIVFVSSTNHKSTNIKMYIPQCESINNEANEEIHEIEIKSVNNDNLWFQLSKCVCAYEQTLCEGTGKTIFMNGTNVTLDNFKLKSVKLCRPDWQERQKIGQRICG